MEHKLTRCFSMPRTQLSAKRSYSFHVTCKPFVNSYLFQYYIFSFFITFNQRFVFYIIRVFNILNNLVPSLSFWCPFFFILWCMVFEFIRSFHTKLSASSQILIFTINTPSLVNVGGLIYRCPPQKKNNFSRSGPKARIILSWVYFYMIHL